MYECEMVSKISAKTSMGKEGKFQAFVLLSLRCASSLKLKLRINLLRDHQLPGLLPLLAWSPVTQDMYDEHSIFRQPKQLSALSGLLSALKDFEFILEKSLLYGIDF